MSNSVEPIALGQASARQAQAVASAQMAKTGFQTLLTALRQMETDRAAAQSPAGYTVKRGDTLSDICATALRASGEAYSQADIMTAAKRVAVANKLRSADRIFAGQELDLSAIRGNSVASADAQMPQGGGTMPPAQWGLAVLADAVKSSQPADTGRIQGIVRSAVRVTSPFGLRKNPFTGRAEFHSGIDLAAAKGTPVYPVRPGEVVFSGWQPGYGKVVIVSHEDGDETLYAHNERNLVQRGQRVDWDAPIGRVGSTGDSTGPHVHFEVRKNGRAINPTAFATESLKVAKAL